MGSGLPVDIAEVNLRDTPARVAFASSQRLVITIPDELEGGRVPVRLGDATVGELSIGTVWATGLHQVDNPVFSRDGSLFVTYSGSRGQETPVSIFKVTPDGTREPFASGIVNATSMAIGPDGKLYVSSRFEGAVYRVAPDGTPEQVASDLGVACGIAFDPDGWMFVGDRSGTIFRVRDGRATAFATLPASVAAFHLAMSPDGDLYVTAPTLGSYDPIYKIDRQGQVTAIAASLGRPQGLTFGPDRHLYIVDALAGSSGLHRLEADGSFTPIVAGGTLIGVAFGPGGELVVASNETAYRFE
jgi:sugar lactone lactonase YvrE